MRIVTWLLRALGLRRPPTPLAPPGFLVRGRRAIRALDGGRIEGAEWTDARSIDLDSFGAHSLGDATSWHAAVRWISSARQSDHEVFPRAYLKGFHMNDWPAIAVVLLTYEPGGEHPRGTAAKTLRSFLDNARYSGPLDVHIADDGSDESHRARLVEIAGGYENVRNVGTTNAERGGYGRSYNLALQAVHSGAELVLPLEDDWELLRPLDLDPLAMALDMRLVDQERAVRDDWHFFDCLRLGYIGYTQELRGRITRSAAGVVFHLDPDSPEPHVFAGHPRLETREFERRVGPWPEGIPAGRTEFIVSERREAREGVGFPLDVVAPRGDLFAHIGALELGELEPGS